MEGLPRFHCRPHKLAVPSAGVVTSIHILTRIPQAPLVTMQQYLSTPASATKPHAMTSDSRPPLMSFSALSTHSAPDLVALVEAGHGPEPTVHPHCCPQPHGELILSLLPSGDKWPWDCHMDMATTIRQLGCGQLGSQVTLILLVLAAHK